MLLSQPIKKRKLSWIQIKNNPDLLKAIKNIASSKFQEYIIRKIQKSQSMTLDNKESHIIESSQETMEKNQQKSNKEQLRVAN